jgi:hypothetical protein
MSEAAVLTVRNTLLMVATDARGQACAALPGSVEREVCTLRFEEARETLHRFERHSMLPTTTIEPVEVPA